MRKIGIIVNPHAKKVRKGRVSIDDFVKYDSPDVLVRVTQTLDEVENILNDFKKQKVDYVGITGGDGSLHHVLSRMMKVYKEGELPPILILKGGTMDNVSRTIKLRGTGFKILKRLIKKIEQEKEIKTYRRDTLQIGDHYCFLFGNGFVANFLNDVYQSEKG